ncbi:MAG: isopentenyl-diphosphate Delta-isomerase [Patescibacteria group bacterium]
MIIKVDDEDKKLGEIEKLKAHEEGILHRAFSIFIFNDEGEMLLQKRAEGKYHGGGLWSNTCCSHPNKDGGLKKQAKRRLKEEMGFTAEIGEVGTVKYNLEVGDLTEHEYDHLFIGTYNGKVNPNPKEVSDYKWLPLSEIEKDIKEDPNNYTPWFKEILPKVLEIININ